MTDIESRLARVETKILDIEEQNMALWKSHDNHADVFRKEIRELMEKIIERMSDLPCKGHIEKFRAYDRNIDLLWKVVLGVIFGGIVFGIWMHSVMGGI
jgi:hypothetical protein